MSDRIESVRAAVAMIRARMSEVELVEAVAINAVLVAISASVDADTHSAAHTASTQSFEASLALRSCPKRGSYGLAVALVGATEHLVWAAYHAMSERWAALGANDSLSWVMIDIERHSVERASVAA